MALQTPIELHGHNSAGEVISFKVADNADIPAYSLMVLSGDDRTVKVHSADTDKFVGIASSDKKANTDNKTIGVYTKGVFSIAANGTINAGDAVILHSSENTVKTSATIDNPNKLVGIALDKSSDGYVSVRINK